MWDLPKSGIEPMSLALAGKPSTTETPGKLKLTLKSSVFCTIYCMYIIFWASLVAQMVKNLLATQETWVQSPGWEDPLEEDMATYSSSLSWRMPRDRGAWQVIVHGVAKSWT